MALPEPHGLLPPTPPEEGNPSVLLWIPLIETGATNPIPDEEEVHSIFQIPHWESGSSGLVLPAVKSTRLRPTHREKLLFLSCRTATTKQLLLTRLPLFKWKFPYEMV